MSASALWRQLRSAWQAQPPHASERPDDLLVNQPGLVEVALQELARAGRGLALQTADGAFLGEASLACSACKDGTAAQVHLTPRAAGEGPGQPTTSESPARWAWPLNAAAATPLGMVMFTLTQGRVDGGGGIHARWPQQLVRVQSRRHFRLTALGGLRPRALLRFDGCKPALPLRNLSEGGLRLDLPPGLAFEPPRKGAAELLLDSERLSIDEFEVMHTHPQTGSQTDSGSTEHPRSIGMRLSAMAGEQRRALRRWIDSAQAGASVRSNR